MGPPGGARNEICPPAVAEMISSGDIEAFSSARLMRGLASSVLGQVLTFTQAILLVPLFLRAWNTDEYGRWLAVLAAVAPLALLDLGGQAFIGNSLAHAFAQGDEEEFRRKASSGLSLFVFLVLAAFPILLIASFCFPFGNLSPQWRAIIVLVGTAQLLSVPGGVLVSCFRATGQLARGNMVGNVSRVIGVVLFALALLVKVSPLIYAAVFLFTGVITTSAVIFEARRKIPALRGIVLSWSKAKEGRSLLRGSLVYWVVSLSQILNLQGLLLVLSGFLGDTAVAFFSTHRAAVGIISYPTSLLQPAVWSELSFLVARKQTARIEKVVVLSVRAVVLLAGVLALALWVAVPVVFSLWTRHRFALQSSLLAVLVLQAVMMSGWSTSAWPLLAANQHSRLAAWSLANALLTIASTTVALSLGWGVLGAAVATTVADVLCGLAVFPRLAARFVHIPSSRIYGAMGRAIAALLPVVIACLVCIHFVPFGWARLVLCSLIAPILLVPTLWMGFGRGGVAQIFTGLRAATGGSAK